MHLTISIYKLKRLGILMTLLVATAVSKIYADGEHQIDILQQVNLTVSAGEHVAIIGSSGSDRKNTVASPSQTPMIELVITSAIPFDKSIVYHRFFLPHDPHLTGGATVLLTAL